MLNFFFKTRRKKVSRDGPAFNSDPELQMLWCQLRTFFFPDRPDLDTYVVGWSSRKQKRVLGSCHIVKRRVKIAKALRHTDYAQWLSPLLYHEMCHAYLGLSVEKARGKRLWHGPQFHALEGRHPNFRVFKSWVEIGGWQVAVERDDGIEPRRFFIVE